MLAEYLSTHDLNAMLLPREQRRPFPPVTDRASWDALPQRAELISWGNQALNGYPMLTATQFMAFVRTGDRQAYETPYFQRRKKLMGAVLAECVTDQGDYLDAVIDGLWCICEESSWVISAHNGSSHPGMRPVGERPLPDVENPYIDLFAAQTAATLCYTLYFLKDKLNAVSPLIVRRVMRELNERIFLPFMTRDDFWWMGMIRQDVNNWTPWILSNIIDSMLLTMDDPLRLAEGLKRAMRMLDSYLAVMPEDGGCDEGCGYWNMAGASLLDCLESLYLATGGKVDFYQEPLIKSIGAFPEKAYIGGGWYWNFADCDAKPIMDGERLRRYGMRTGNAELSALGAELLKSGESLPGMDTPQMNRVLFALFEQPQPQAPALALQDRQVALHRLGVYAWRRGGLYLAVKGGHNGENHNHNDLGGFILYADGEPHVVDAGNIQYTAKTFGSERYTLWNTRSLNHSVPLIGGEEQHDGAEYRVENVRLTANAVSMELAHAYPPEAGIITLERGFALTEDDVRLMDQATLSEAKPVTWVFMLRMKPEIRPGRLRFGKLEMRFAASELSLGIEEIPVTDLRLSRSYPGSLWRVSLTAAPAVCHAQEFVFLRS